MIISFVLNLSLLIIRIECHNNYIKLFRKDSFTRLNLYLIILNIFQMFMIILIILFIILLFFVSNEKWIKCSDSFCCCKNCNCVGFKAFFASICEKVEKSNDSNDQSEPFINTENSPLNSSNKKEIVDNGKKPEIIKRNPEELIKPEENSPVEGLNKKKIEGNESPLISENSSIINPEDSVEGLNKKKLWVMKFLKHQNLHQ